MLEEERTIKPDVDNCPKCKKKLTTVKCPCHRWCRNCRISYEVDLSE